MIVCRGKSQPHVAGRGLFCIGFRLRETSDLLSRRDWSFLAIAIIAIAFCQSTKVCAQQTPFVVPTVNRTGLPEGASFEGVNESINLTNGDVLVVIPLLKLPGLAGLDFDLNLRIDSKTYISTGDSPILPSTKAGPNFAGGRLSIPGLSFDYVDHEYYEDDPLHSGSGSYHHVTCDERFVFRDMNGTQHGFNNRLPCRPTNALDGTTPPITYDDTYDGSLMRLDTSNPQDMVVYDKNGIQYHFNIDGGPIRILDLNGNKITIDYHNYVNSSGLLDYTSTITDTLNRVVTITADAITYKDSSGNSQQITASTLNDAVNVIHRTITAEFDPNTEISFPANYPIDVATYSGQPDTHSVINFPTGEKYTIYYDALQEPTKVIYPSGGYTRYSYQNVPGFLHDTPWSFYEDIREIQQRAICTRTDGNCSSSEEAVTTYTADMLTYLNGNKTLDVRDPYGNRTHYEFSAVPYFFARDGGAPKETDQYIYSGESTLLRTIHTDYYTENVPDPEASIRACSQPSKVTTTFNDVSPTIQSRMEYEYEHVHPHNSYAWDVAGMMCGSLEDLTSNVITRREYDFDGSLARTTSTQWLTNTTDGTHLLDRVTGETIADATGFTSTKGWGYDDAGNRTSETFGGTAMSDATTVLERDSYGRLISSTDPLNNKTTYGYDSPWADSTCAGASGPPPSPSSSSVKDALSHVTSTVYNLCTGTVHSTTDANGQTTTFAYDAIARQTHATYPTGGGELTTGYDPQPGNTVTRIRTLDSNRSATTKEIHDGVGRVVTQQNLAPTEGTTTIETTYDNRGLTASVSNPFLTHDDSTYGVTSYAYDALGRVQYVCNPDNGTSTCSPGANYRENAYSGAYVDSFDELRKHTRKRADALGRGIRMWEPDETNSPVVETQYQYNGLDLLTSVNQLGKSTATTQGSSSDAPRTRSFQYGGRGQLIKSVNPESGTICYGSLNSGNCVSGYDANNRLVTKTDARGVVTTFAYDKLNRLTGKTYSGSVDPNQSPLATCYAYDQDANSGTNTVGRLVSEWTEPNACDSAFPSSAVSWKTGLSYDTIGRLIAESQCPIAPCPSLNPMTYTYDFAGSVTSSNNGLPSSASPGIGAIYDYDNASRFARVSTTWDASNHPPVLFYAYGSMNINQVSSPAYGPFGLMAAQYGLDYKSTDGSLAELRSYDTRGRLATKTVFGNAAATVSPTVTTVSANPPQSNQGGLVTILVQVDCQSACGQVDVVLDTTIDLGPQTLDANGRVTLTSTSFPTSALAVGSHTVKANYLGDSTHAASTNSTSYTVLASNQFITLLMSSQSITRGDGPIITAHVACSPYCAGVHLVVDGVNWFGFGLTPNGDLNVDTWQWGPLSPNFYNQGHHSLVAYYDGDSTFAPAQSNTVEYDVWPTGSTQVKPALSFSKTDFTLAEDSVAIVHHDCNSACGYVTITIDGNVWTTRQLDSNGNASIDTFWWWSPYLYTGSHHLQAHYYGNITYAQMDSDIVDFTVRDIGNQPMDVTLDMNPMSFSAGGDTTASVHLGCGSSCGLVQITVDGNVWFTWGGHDIDSNGNLVESRYAWWTNLFSTPNQHNVQAIFLGNSTYATSYSRVVTVTTY